MPSGNAEHFAAGGRFDACPAAAAQDAVATARIGEQAAGLGIIDATVAVPTGRRYAGPSRKYLLLRKVVCYFP
jgi:hypothetical protein